MAAVDQCQAETAMSEQARARVTELVEEWLNEVPIVAKRLAVSKFTVTRMIKAGHIHAVRVGKRLLIPESEVRRIMAVGCGKHANGK